MKGLLKRLNIYFKESHPLLKCTLIPVILFFQIYFFIILIEDVGMFRIGIPEIVGCFTLFTFLLSLRIADDFKDYKSDQLLFPDRPLPSGRVTKKDLAIVLAAVNVAAAALNVIFMNNLLYYAALMAYGALMSVWFFARSTIQKSLPLALLTHNPVGLIMNIYIISYTCIAYGLPVFTWNNLLLAFSLYWPTLMWEMARKVRAPEDETQYTTYSKLFGYKKVTWWILGIITMDLITSAVLMYELWAWGLFAVVAAYVWFVIECFRFLRQPKRFKLVSRIEIYEGITEVPVILIEIGLILARGLVWV